MIFILSLFSSICLLLAEVALAYCLQLLLRAAGLTHFKDLDLPFGSPKQGRHMIFILIMCVGTARGIFSGFSGYLKGSFQDVFLHHQRKAVLDWSFLSPSCNGSQFSLLFGAHLSEAAIVMTSVQSIVVSVLYISFLSAFLFKISLSITLVLGFVLFALIVPLQEIQKRVSQFGKGVSRSNSAMLGRLNNSIKNMVLLKIFGQASNERKSLQISLDEIFTRKLKSHKWAGLSVAYTQILGVFLITSVAVFKRTNGGISSALVLSYFYLLFRLLQQLPGIAQNFNSIQFSKHNAILLLKWWQQNYHEIETSIQSDQEESNIERESRVIPLKDPLGWKVNQVTFGYSVESKPIFSNFSLSVDPGSVFVLTGPSGSGKSTLLSLLLGQVKPQEGSLSAVLNQEEHSLQAIRPKLLQHIGYVGPEAYVIEGSLRDNLSYGLRQPRAFSDLELNEVLEQAECSFVKDLPGGLDYCLNYQGLGLSSGQKQRISLARALLRRPSALILDEATSNLDSNTEEKLIQTFAKLKGKITLIVATHRHPLIRLADQHIEL